VIFEETTTASYSLPLSKWYKSGHSAAITALSTETGFGHEASVLQTFSSNNENQNNDCSILKKSVFESSHRARKDRKSEAADYRQKTNPYCFRDFRVTRETSEGFHQHKKNA